MACRRWSPASFFPLRRIAGKRILKNIELTLGLRAEAAGTPHFHRSGAGRAMQTHGRSL
jgi:hypothetical protein